ncbi:type VI secretion system Vgr family protein [Aquimarina muelleri]|uniref:Type IV secretion protein Rhs n=2 Tax=Aquimarina muelleri TaxID=279356 RepID=A0A918N5P7_9FLAO|nr:phage baseplate assembly protein V [Aquimarina muelleri]MCX2761514.1 phage baseplate assembly protein V [Aquimarina muelleri]GGX32300.1 type IV secretion protein Rhs [Aquimarina muelleri]
MIEPKTSLRINGEPLFNFEQVTLSQSINAHHSFSITVDYDSVETVGAYTLDTSKEWLGKSVVINFNDTEFVGIITSVKLRHDNGYDGKLVVSGYSKTIVLENKPHIHSWSDTNLRSILTDTINAVDIPAQIAPVFSSRIAYQTQYRESHFKFIQRMAKQYNEWLYYDGVQLVFGKPTLPNPIAIEYGADMDSIDISIQTIASSGTDFSYNALEDTKNESKTLGQVAGLNELGTHAFETSKSLFNVDTKGYSTTRVKDKSEIDTIVKNKQASTVAQASVLSGTSTKQGLTIGSVIKVTAAQKGIGAFDIKNYGEYIITKITHDATGSSEYTNSFEAISSGIQILPEPEVDFPEAHPQIATVVSNQDPKQKGRVQVQFQWQIAEMKTSWIRVMTPDAGSSSTHAQNRGHVFIPEVGDQVMVGFRYNDPNRPFVMGSLFNGSTGAGGRDQNNYKSIITRSGHTIAFNDTDRSESITITDKKGNHLIIDTAGETITINALKDININAGENLNITAGKNIRVNAGENIDESAGRDITSNAGNDILQTASKDIKEKADNIKQIADNVFDIQSKESTEYADKINIQSLKEEINMLSAKKVHINAKEKSNLF